MNRPSRPFLTVGAVLAAAVIVLATGVTIGVIISSDDRAGKPSSQPTTQLDSADGSDSARRGSATESELAADFDELQRTLDADVGLAFSAVGSDQLPTVLGSWTTGPAWSTIKVPLVIAAMRESASHRPSQAMISAITLSDNDAATEVWEGLGDPETASSKVETVLRETGDPTVVQSQKVRPEFTAFGQTVWSLTDQLRFIAAAACDTANTPVLELMEEITGDQRWGIGELKDVRFKGGWGPSPEGKYLVRQFGLIPTASGISAVAVAVSPASGSLEDGEAALTAITRWVRSHEYLLPAAECP